MPVSTTPRKLAWIFLPMLSIVFSAITFFFASNTINRQRADFCAYLANVYHVTKLLPQVPARVEAEKNDLDTAKSLGC